MLAIFPSNICLMAAVLKEFSSPFCLFSAALLELMLSCWTVSVGGWTCLLAFQSIFRKLSFFAVEFDDGCQVCLATLGFTISGDSISTTFLGSGALGTGTSIFFFGASVLAGCKLACHCCLAALGLTMLGDSTYPCVLELFVFVGGVTVGGGVICWGCEGLDWGGLKVGEGEGLLLMIPWNLAILSLMLMGLSSLSIVSNIQQDINRAILFSITMDGDWSTQQRYLQTDE